MEPKDRPRYDLPIVTSTGETIEQMIQKLEKKRYTIWPVAKDVLAKIETTTGITYEPVVIWAKCNEIATDIQKIVEEYDYEEAPPELVLLLRDKISPTNMKEWGKVMELKRLVITHKPIEYYGDFVSLYLDSENGIGPAGGRYNLNDDMGREHGYVYIKKKVEQVSG